MKLIDRFRNFFAKESVSQLKIDLENEQYKSKTWKQSYDAAVSWNRNLQERVNQLSNLIERPVQQEEQQQAGHPVGSIEYYSPGGKVVERNIYTNEAELVRDIKNNSFFGEAYGITLFKDPETGKHIDSSWLKDLDCLPKTYRIEEYSDQEQLTQEQEAPEEDDSPDYDD